MLILKPQNLQSATEYLQSGQTIIFPTETCYGLGCDAANQSAVDKIFKIKGRRQDKPLLIVVPTVEMAKNCLEWTELLEELAVKHWPGALTIVGKYSILNIKYLANGVVAEDNTVAVRVTANKLLKELAEKLGRPIVATSANISDTGEIYDSQELIKMYENREFQPDAIIDAGILPKNPPSTIVSVVNNKLKVLRQGETIIKDIKDIRY